MAEIIAAHSAAIAAIEALTTRIVLSQILRPLRRSRRRVRSRGAGHLDRHGGTQACLHYSVLASQLALSTLSSLLVLGISASAIVQSNK